MENQRIFFSVQYVVTSFDWFTDEIYFLVMTFFEETWKLKSVKISPG